MGQVLHSSATTTQAVMSYLLIKEVNKLKVA